MRTPALALILAALATAAAAAPAKPAPHKAAPARPTVEAAGPALPSGPFDARDSADVAALLGALGGKAEVASKDKTGVLLKVSSPAGGFTVQFDGCNQQGRLCQAMQFEAFAEAKTATLAEVNAFNQASLACRIFQDKQGKPHVAYSALVFGSTSRTEAVTHVNAWRGCLSDFAAFLKDPPGYLASAP
jgi:hypothetical protein